jgi:hypothetical protein
MAALDDRTNIGHIDVAFLQLNCEADKVKIAHYAKCLIDGQRGNFEDGTAPWDNLECQDKAATDSVLLAIQHNGTDCPDILGWLRYTTETIAGLNIVFINGLSTAKRKYKQTGRTLVEVLIMQTMLRQDIIEISPLSAVIGFYKKLEFQPLYDGGPYYRWISTSKEPTKDLIDGYRDDTIKSEKAKEKET